MLLENKTAIVYGGGGALGGAVSHAFAREGARVFITGRTAPPLEKVAASVRSSGGTIDTAVFDAFDEAAVDAHASEVVARAGAIDISFNLVSYPMVQGTPLVDMTFDDFHLPVVGALKSTFVTARAGARHMIRQGSGVILMFGGDGDPMREHALGGFQVALQGVEALRRQLAMELGKHGIRVLTLQTCGILETIPPDFEPGEEIARMTVARTMLGRGATLADVGNVAAFAASDWARAMTGTKLNITCGSVVD